MGVVFDVLRSGEDCLAHAHQRVSCEPADRTQISVAGVASGNSGCSTAEGSDQRGASGLAVDLAARSPAIKQASRTGNLLILLVEREGLEPDVGLNQISNLRKSFEFRSPDLPSNARFWHSIWH